MTMMKRCLETICFVAGVAWFLTGCSGEDPVTPENNPPVLVAMPDTSTTVGSTLRLMAVATDRDGDPITYHLTVIIGGFSDPLPDAHIDKSSGEFVFKPAASDQPSRDFIIDVQDGHGGEDTTRFTVTVN